ncbi:MAG: SDR family oxidoreductase [Proteobacteria bacterium]|nr:SDR family oxidoreductase [Pseudomonadota bacterium]HQR03064.1 SDR family oxidoreductase [Rhodocyclaceae bacterium]
MLLKDKVTIVSGIGPGLGIKLAQEAARQGAKVVLLARTAQKLDEAEALIKSEVPGCQILKTPADISNTADVARVVQQTVERFGRIDALINSAYNGGNLSPFEDSNLKEWDNVFKVNLFGTLTLTQAVIPIMKKQGGGAVVMVNTMTVRKPMIGQIDYAASKAALASATAHLALEYGAAGIRFNSAFMGWMWGPAVEGHVKHQAASAGVTEEVLKAEIAKMHALNLIPTDTECAKPVIFLASDYASMVTGASLDVNGGAYIPH